MTISGATYREGIAFSPDGAMYVTPTGAATITSGTIDGSSLDNGSGIPVILLKTAIPFIHISSGSIAAGGGISGITALPSAYPNAYCYFPANAVATVSAAGWYYCTFSTTTAGTAFLNTYTSGVPTIPSSPTAVTDGKGAFTGDTTERTSISIPVPAGSMGANGRIEVVTSWSATSNANAKTVRILWAASTNAFSGSIASTAGMRGTAVIANRGNAAIQVTYGFGATDGATIIATANQYDTVNTGSATTANIRTVHGTATDNLVVESVAAYLYSDGT